MEYETIDGISKPISRLVQGTVMCCDPETGADTFPLLDAIFEQGCTTFDTAHVYGSGWNERNVGEWVNSRGIRDQVVILGKGAHHNEDRKRVTPFDITADIHDSLARFKFEYIDLYLLHRDNPKVPVGPIVEILNEHKKAGLIHAFGGSNWSAERIQEANAYAEENSLTPFMVSSPNYSLADQIKAPWDDCVTISGPSHAEERAWYAQEQFPLFCWSSLAGGFFSGRLNRDNHMDHRKELFYRCYFNKKNMARLDRAEILADEKGLTIPQVAMAFVMSQPMNIFALVGCNTPEEFTANAEAAKIKLTESELAWLDLMSDSR